MFCDDPLAERPLPGLFDTSRAAVIIVDIEIAHDPLTSLSTNALERRTGKTAPALSPATALNFSCRVLDIPEISPKKINGHNGG